MNLALRLPALKLPQIASKLALPKLRVPALPVAAIIKSSRGFWLKHHWALVALWLAFMAGLVGADFWFTSKLGKPQPEAALEVAPVPLPLVAGVDPVDAPLDPAPAAGLEEVTAEGKLPVIGKDGRTPLAAYAYPFDRNEARPRISIVLTDVGPQAGLLRDAITRLPGSVALAFSAHTPSLGTAMAAARQAGHETLLLIPADSSSPLAYDPGPGALRLGLPVLDNLQRLRLLMGKATGYVGLMVNPETALLNINNLPGALLTEARQRGLLLLSNNQTLTDRGISEGSSTAQITLALDASLDPADLDARLAELEQRAREGGHVVATSALYPFVIRRLAEWLPSLSEKGIAIAPVSAAASLPAAAPQDAPQPAVHSSPDIPH